MDKVEFTFKDGSVYIMCYDALRDRAKSGHSKSIAHDMMDASIKFNNHYFASPIELRIDFILKTYNKL